MKRLDRWRARVALAAVAGATAAAAVGCNFVVGAGDYAVGKGDASTEEGGASDAGSSNSDAPHADAGGPILCGQGLAHGPEFDKLVRSCLLVESCDPYFFNVTISQCINEDFLHSTTSLQCLNDITDCSGFYDCMGYGYAALSDCSVDDAGARCDTATNRAINCAGLASGIVTDCKKNGGTCGTYTTDAGTVADCVVPGGCSDTDGQEHCTSNNEIYTCIDGQPFGENCGASTCAVVNGSAGCYFHAPPCGMPGYSCATNAGHSVVAWCSDGNQLLTYDCTRAGGSCVLDDGGAADCVSPGCVPTDDCVESCASDGKTLNLCVGGAPLQVDCTQNGFAQCVESTRASDKVVYAHCF